MYFGIRELTLHALEAIRTFREDAAESKGFEQEAVCIGIRYPPLMAVVIIGL